MELRLSEVLWAVLILCVLTTVSGESDRDLKFCGLWHHRQGPVSLNVNLTTGCDRIVILANESSLSVVGQITAKCVSLTSISLTDVGSKEDKTFFCVFWEPLLDQLTLKIGNKVLPLCSPSSLKDYCCTQMSNGPNCPERGYGISDGRVRDDLITHKTVAAYEFNGSFINCREEYCKKDSQGSIHHSMAVENRANPCADSTAVTLKDSEEGYNVTLKLPDGVPPEPVPSIHLPSALKKATKSNNEVVCTFFRNNSLFQEGQNNAKILSVVVSITMENEIIRDLPEPITIGFHHDVILKSHSRKCVSWDTKKDPLKVNWLVDGCKTRVKGENETECLCNHLTYFSVLVQLEPRPVRHLLALSAITSLGCAVSLISCIVLIIYLCKKSRKSKELSIPIHVGLAVSLAILNLLFFFTGVLANVGGEGVCFFVAAGLHYALISSLIWMGIEVFHTFWLVHMVFRPAPKLWIWYLTGFGLPALPVIVLLSISDIYGLREIYGSDDLSDPYLMCWMKDSDKALLAHYVINVTLLVILVTSGLVILFLVYKEIRNRDEWRQNRVAFLSIWGLSCLFGTSWGLNFLNFGPLSDFFHFAFCILNSFQGFLLMLRFYMLDWMRKQAGGSVLGSSSTGSTRQHMLQVQEKS